MTRDEVLARLVAERAVYEAKLAKVPSAHMDAPPPGHTHSVKEVVAHVTAYEEMIVKRLVAARRGETTALERDRKGWERFNDRTWGMVRDEDAETVKRRSHEVFGELLGEVRNLTDAELNEFTGVTVHIDPAWLDGKALWELIAIDSFEHYPMHHAAIEAAADYAVLESPEI